MSLELVITLAKHLIYKKYFYVPPNDLSEMLPLFIDRHCVRNKQAILLCSINSYMLRDHICNAKCTNLECLCFHCSPAPTGQRGSPMSILEHFLISWYNEFNTGTPWYNSYHRRCWYILIFCCFVKLIWYANKKVTLKKFARI